MVGEAIRAVLRRLGAATEVSLCGAAVRPRGDITIKLETIAGLFEFVLRLRIADYFVRASKFLFNFVFSRQVKAAEFNI